MAWIAQKTRIARIYEERMGKKFPVLRAQIVNKTTYLDLRRLFEKRHQLSHQLNRFLRLLEKFERGHAASDATFEKPNIESTEWIRVCSKFMITGRWNTVQCIEGIFSLPLPFTGIKGWFCFFWKFPMQASTQRTDLLLIRCNVPPPLPIVWHCTQWCQPCILACNHITTLLFYQLRLNSRCSF